MKKSFARSYKIRGCIKNKGFEKIMRLLYNDNILGMKFSMFCTNTAKSFMVCLVLVFNFAINYKVMAKDTLENKNSVGIELGGSHILYSLQYERRVLNWDNKMLNIRVGISYLNIGENMFVSKSPNFSWSLSPNIIIGKQRNKAEFSVGYTLFNGLYKPNNSNRYKIYPDHYFTGQIAYRYYFPKEKFYFKAGGILLIRAFYFNTYSKHYPGYRVPDVYIPFMPSFSVGFAYNF